MNFNPEDYRIFECVTGSRLYGTHTENSDYDYRGVCLPPMNILLDPFNNFDQKDSGFEEDDRTIYNLKKFFQLCADNNPNILELLFIPSSNIVFTTNAWRKVIENRELFVSKKAKYTFSGYAFSQIKAVERRRQWFINPPHKKPEREDYGLPENTVIHGEVLKVLDNIKSDIINEKYSDLIEKEKQYRKDKKHWDNYQSWAKNRNPERKALEDKFQYDCKFASHTMRLITEGKELLETGHITFPLYNAKFLLDIKNGVYSYEEFISMVSDLDNEFDELYEESTLQHSANKKKLEELYFQILEMKK